MVWQGYIRREKSIELGTPPYKHGVHCDMHEKITVVLNNNAERVGVVEFNSRLQLVVSPGQPADPNTTYGCC